MPPRGRPAALYKDSSGKTQLKVPRNPRILNAMALVILAWRHEKPTIHQHNVEAAQSEEPTRLSHAPFSSSAHRASGSSHRRSARPRRIEENHPPECPDADAQTNRTPQRVGNTAPTPSSQQGTLANDVVALDDIHTQQFAAQFSSKTIEEKLTSIGTMAFAFHQQLAALKADVNEWKANLIKALDLNSIKGAERWLTGTQKSVLKRYCLSSILALCTGWESAVQCITDNVWDDVKELFTDDCSSDGPARKAVELLTSTYIVECKHVLSEAIIDSVRPNGTVALESFATSFLAEHGVPVQEPSLNAGRLAQLALLRKVGQQFTERPTAGEPPAAVSDAFWTAAESEYARYVRKLGQDQHSDPWQRWIQRMIDRDSMAFGAQESKDSVLR